MGTAPFWYNLTMARKSPLQAKAFSDAFFQQYPDARNIIGLFDCLPSALFYAKDSQHRYVAVNTRNLVDVFGLEVFDDLLGRTDSDFQPPALAEAYHAEDRRVMESRQPIPNQVWLVPHVRGTPRWYVSSKTPLLDQNGRVIGIAGVMYPIETPEEQASFFQELLPAIRFMDANYKTTISMQEMATISACRRRSSTFVFARFSACRHPSTS